MITVIDTEEEKRTRDQLHQMVDIPVAATSRDVEYGDEKVHGNHVDLPSSDLCVFRGVCCVFILIVFLVIGLVKGVFVQG
jgi:hypothetical protein